METLGFAGKMRKRHAETTRPSGKYGLKDEPPLFVPETI
jgi:hypothetical protein